MFKTKLEDIMNRFIPSKLSSRRFSLPWVTKEIKQMINKKQRLYNKAKKFKRESDWAAFRQLRKDIQKKTQQAYWKYVADIVDPERDSQKKSFWHYIKSLNKDHTGISPLKDNGILHTDSKSKAEILSNQFKSVFTKENLDNIPKLPPEHRFPQMPQVQVTEKGVEKLLRNLKPNKASGPDNIPARILKEMSPTIAPILTTIYQKSLDSGILPSDWLKAHIVPIYKKSDRTIASNYRPVSLTSIPCKILEHIVSKSIHNHLQTHNILTDVQHGFRQRRSCETSLLTTVHDLTSTLGSKNRQIDLILLDFSKAFDTVPHNRLLAKLDHYGIRTSTQLWIRNFLTDRTQEVLVEGCRSGRVQVTSGVPQGTVLGPLLFLLYINDMPTSISPGTSIKLFADDAMLYRTVNKLTDAISLQNDLDRLIDWEQTWQMAFNPSKCQVMHITRSKTTVNSSYTIHGTPLETVPTATHLGIDISNTLSWNTHIDKIVKKANSKLGFIRRNLRGVPQSIKACAYTSLVRPHLEYCGSVWDPYTQRNIKRLEGVQHRAARFVVHNYNWDVSGATLASALDWSTLEQRRAEARLANMYKITNNIIDIDPDQYFTTSTRRTRSSNHPHRYTQHSTSTNFHAYSFFPRSIVQWNRLSPNTVQAPSLDAFKGALQDINLTVAPFRYLP